MIHSMGAVFPLPVMIILVPGMFHSWVAMVGRVLR